VHGFLRFSKAQTASRLREDAEYLLPELTAAEQWHFWFQSRRRLVAWAVSRYFPELRSLLDVGCGTGFVLEGIRAQHPNAWLSGSDAMVDALVLARARMPDVFWFEALADALPFEDEFDVVLALDVIEHIDCDAEAISGLFRATARGGGVILTVPQHPSLWSAVDEFSCHRRRYTRADLLRKTRAAGFEILRCTSCFMLTLPLVVASRWRRRGVRFEPSAELRIPRAANRVLRTVQELEWSLIRAGLSLPVGGSLLIVARRPAA
jgi:SAM-dependent methyltransferase